MSIATCNMAIKVAALSVQLINSQIMALCSVTCLGFLEWTESSRQNMQSIRIHEKAKKLSAGYTLKNTDQ